MKIILLGVGIQGIATALDLAWNKNIDEVILADIDLKRAEYVSNLCNEKYGNKTKPVFVDVNDHDMLIALFKNSDFVINEVNYYFNRKVMEACLEAGVNYMDIGGLYIETIEQIKYNERFKDAGRNGKEKTSCCAS
jgi:saccharopine dehydrogenase (NAD+, L-lysine-forming)